jgi:hypothetical protein
MELESFTGKLPNNPKNQASSDFTTKDVPSKDTASVVIEIETTIYQIDEQLTPLDRETLAQLKEFLVNLQVVAFQSSIDGKFFVIWKLDELHVLPVLDDIKRDDLDELCRFIVEFMVESLGHNHAGE